MDLLVDTALLLLSLHAGWSAAAALSSGVVSAADFLHARSCEPMRFWMRVCALATVSVSSVVSLFARL
jgi:hypothetical protein